MVRLGKTLVMVPESLDAIEYKQEDVCEKLGHEETHVALNVVLGGYFLEHDAELAIVVEDNGRTLSHVVVLARSVVVVGEILCGGRLLHPIELDEA